MTVEKNTLEQYLSEFCKLNCVKVIENLYGLENNNIFVAIEWRAESEVILEKTLSKPYLLILFNKKNNKNKDVYYLSVR